MGTNSGAYKALFVLHMLAVIVGIGTVMLNGLYGAIAKRRGDMSGVAVSEANLEVSEVAQKVIYTIPLFGIAMVLVSDDAIEFTDTWIWLSLVLFVVAMGISHGVLTPAHRRINEVTAKLSSGQGGPADAAEVDALGKKLAAAGGTLNVIVVIFVALMIWKPGV